MDEITEHARESAEHAHAHGPPQGFARRVALLVCHGMGQQVPFETTDAVATQLARVAAREAGAAAPAVVLDPRRDAPALVAAVVRATVGLLGMTPATGRGPGSA